MAVIGIYSFEAQEASTDNIARIGTTSYSTTTVRTGAASIRSNPASGANGEIDLLGTGAAFTMFGFRYATTPTVDRPICGSISASTINVRLTTGGALAVYVNTTLIGTSSALTINTWYWIGVRASTGTSVVYLQIDGVDAVTGTATATGSMTVFGVTGSGASAMDVFYDDVISDDANFLASSKVDIALPISDNTRTAVTTNSGGTTNLWDCVNNTPPAGVASANEAAAGAVSILYPASTTENYIADLETYTTLGINSGDTVLAVRAIVRHGEDIATGTKNLQNVGALTNPTVGGSSVTAGSDGGAHGAETGLWVTTFGTLTTSPSVTLGTSPTIQASRTSQSRVACIDFMGLLVAWTPAAGKSPPFSRRHRGYIVR